MVKLCIGAGLSLLMLALVDAAHWQTWVGCANGWLTVAVIAKLIGGK